MRFAPPHLPQWSIEYDGHDEVRTCTLTPTLSLHVRGRPGAYVGWGFDDTNLFGTVRGENPYAVEALLWQTLEREILLWVSPVNREFWGRLT